MQQCTWLAHKTGRLFVEVRFVELVFPSFIWTIIDSSNYEIVRRYSRYLVLHRMQIPSDGLLIEEAMGTVHPFRTLYKRYTPRTDQRFHLG